MIAAKTVNDIRRENGLPTIQEGDVPVNLSGTITIKESMSASLPEGILILKGNVTDFEYAEIKRQWETYIKNSPILVIRNKEIDVDYLHIKGEN